MCSRPESNWQLFLRREQLYPFNYESNFKSMSPFHSHALERNRNLQFHYPCLDIFFVTDSKISQTCFDSSRKLSQSFLREHYASLVLSRGIEPLLQAPQACVLSVERRERMKKVTVAKSKVKKIIVLSRETKKPA